MRLPGELDGRRFLRALRRLGWEVTETRGSHRKLRNARRDGFLIVAFHASISRVAMIRVLRQAEITEDEFLRAL